MDEEKKEIKDWRKIREEEINESVKNWRETCRMVSGAPDDEDDEEITEWDEEGLPDDIHERNIRKSIKTLEDIIYDPHCPKDVKEHIKKSIEDIKNNPEKYREKFKYIL